MRGFLGFIIMIQGAMGFIGQTFSDRAWGLLPHFFELPTVCYLLLFAAGVALIAWAEVDRKREQQQ
ncbi:hypothetical protein [Streptomyces sp. ISID311]|uniref:hypothetical protein n=1 Tax=Streptomyces sp. ISID311 TaxID=2601673 RepID=UPI0011BD3D49|nr:hypothetical protein [Streptomyces sp. ISID311]TXC94273.1 hypothetical protein FS847_28440 [Streptomyces sp. ISID311]